MKKTMIVALVIGGFILGTVFSFGVGASATTIPTIGIVLNKVKKTLAIVKNLERYTKVSSTLNVNVADLTSISADNTYKTCLWVVPSPYNDGCRQPQFYYGDLSSVDQNKYDQMRDEINSLKAQGIK